MNVFIDDSTKPRRENPHSARPKFTILTQFANGSLKSSPHLLRACYAPPLSWAAIALTGALSYISI